MEDGTVRKTVVIVGDRHVGKTSLIEAFTNAKKQRDSDYTLGETSTACSILFDNKEVELILLNTAGQEDYDRFRTLVYVDADVFIICFSIDNPDTLANVEAKWLPELKQHRPNTPVVLVGNEKDPQNDACTERRSSSSNTPVEYTQGRNIARRIEAFAYVECSTKRKEGVQEVFENAVRATLAEKERVPVQEVFENAVRATLAEKERVPKARACCMCWR